MEVTVQSSDSLQDVEKLAYLEHAIKDSPARYVIEGLLRTAGSYTEAIGCLQKRYDRQRLIHQAHICTVLEAPSLRNGNGQELRHLHDVIKQHMRALEAMNELLETFMSSVIELKLHQSSMFAWQNHSRDHKKVPPYTDLLEFLYLQARTSENIAHSDDRKRSASGHNQKPFTKSYVTEFI